MIIPETLEQTISFGVIKVSDQERERIQSKQHKAVGVVKSVHQDISLSGNDDLDIG